MACTTGNFFVEVLPFIGTYRGLIYHGIPGLQVGSMVKIQVRHRTCLGIVKTLEAHPTEIDCPYQTVLEVVFNRPILTFELILLAEWLVRYYGCTLSTAFKAILPAMVRQGKTYLPEYGLRATRCVAIFRENSTRQKAIYQWLQQQRDVAYNRVVRQFPKSSQAIQSLLEKGYVEKFKMEPTYPSILNIAHEPFQLTDEQMRIVHSICPDFSKKTHSTHMLLGVTGSGKTEIYHQLILYARQLGLQTLYLVPEIALTEQALKKISLRLCLNEIKVEIWHSRLGERERLRIWENALGGKVDVVVGTRSTLFLPLRRPGLVIVDEEHEPAYKQSDTPRYHGRDLAIRRASLNASVCILGSATPSLETWFNVQNGRYRLHRIVHRPYNRCLPKVHTVNMSFEKPNFEGAFVLSTLLKEKLSDRLDKEEQSLLFLNRRGYAPFLQCNACGKYATCPCCSAHLVYHRSQQIAKCHACERTLPMPRTCPHCGGFFEKSRGLGTQRIEACLQKLYPRARVLRLDADTVSSNPDWYEQMLSRRYDILVGTQMVAKGLDFPRVTLVGLIQADGQLNVNDFRAAERTFQLLVQVGGRAGRAGQMGEVVVQTFSPEASCIQLGVAGKVEDFLNQECRLRDRYGYPPHRHIIRQILRSHSENVLAYTCQQWNSFLRKNLQSETIEILGPAVPPLGKVNNYYRQHVLFFSRDVLGDLPCLMQLQRQFRWPVNVTALWDVDPVDFV
ncbi:MAG: primosomal protein N' [Puniceicoccales bacterium]|jgi:primosomal protein N' (replication factor Y)|nr:primosomal protein N' [Puniceicoccales bacterium]